MVKELTKQSLAAYGIDGVQSNIKDIARRLRQTADEIDKINIPLMPSEHQENALNELIAQSKSIIILGEALDDSETAMRQFLEQYYHKKG